MQDDKWKGEDLGRIGAKTRRKRRGSPSAPVQDLILMEGKAYPRVRWVPTCKKPFVKRENIVLVFREFTIQRRECKDPGK